MGEIKKATEPKSAALSIFLELTSYFLKTLSIYLNLLTLFLTIDIIRDYIIKLEEI